MKKVGRQYRNSAVVVLRIGGIESPAAGTPGSCTQTLLVTYAAGTKTVAKGTSSCCSSRTSGRSTQLLEKHWLLEHPAADKTQLRHLTENTGNVCLATCYVLAQPLSEIKRTVRR